MAAGDVSVYNDFKEQLLRGAFNLHGATDTIKVALLSSYTINDTNLDAHDFFDDVNGTEESGTGYTAGGVTLANKVVAQDNTNNRASFDADDVTWTGLNVGTPAAAVMYKDTAGAASTDPLMLVYELGVASNGGNYTLAFHANGILLLT
jgi:hypothetical protein